MRKILWVILLVILSLGWAIGCGGGVELPSITGGEVKSSGASEGAGFVFAETPAGEEVSIIITAMDESPSEDNLLTFIITTATDDARSQGEGASFEVTNASKQAEPHDPTIIVYTSTQSGNKIYAGWYCDVTKQLFIASLSGSDPGFISSIQCHPAE